ncbi:MAG: phosphoribosylglycinamide formyltransferase [Candidatus Thiodiazotropha sp. (ex Lucinoma kastoroae)]|nr:phosphoribosylglycinamide formyltransferase [Candidatus Thiodiazotropha sp. (ex Rostrolucina anterorostrata)]MCU7848387.1 phosphoribosylglycinamide formyltransferase [Candidatus Thiodiazotropha sp. (ex Lucinoma kastoroae)]MCU7860503.1 phosphoribosylglycinamide formyltransferase [Candidatus Thiodiazotropha sp. (ex Lucinoma kastoroae)]
MTARLPVVVLISGSGTNLQAIIDGAQCDLPIETRAVISNRPGVYGLQRAEQAGIETVILDHREYPDRESYDQALITLIDSYSPKLVALAGFMRILTADFVRHYGGRLLNIHPSLLPKYTGLHTHQRVLDAGDSLHGASIHFVTEELDGGPLIVQAQVPVEAGDDADILAARVLQKEHQIYPLAIRWFAENRLILDENGDVRLDNKRLESPVVFSPLASIG